MSLSFSNYSSAVGLDSQQGIYTEKEIISTVMNAEPGRRLTLEPIDLLSLGLDRNYEINLFVEYENLEEIIVGEFILEGKSEKKSYPLDEVKQGVTISLQDYQLIKPKLCLDGNMTNQWMDQKGLIKYRLLSRSPEINSSHNKLPKTGDQIMIVVVFLGLCILGIAGYCLKISR